MALNLLPRLHEAVTKGDVHLIREFLFACGDHINAIYRQQTALTLALQVGKDESIVRMVLKHPHCDVNAKNQFGRVPLLVAAEEGSVELIVTLLQHGARVNEGDIRGNTPLSICAMYNRFETAKVLLAHGADVNSRDTSGDTPLHVACAHGALEVAMLLIGHQKCDVNSRNSELRTPLMMALPSAYNAQVREQPISQALTISQSLLRAGCDAAARDGLHGSTALHDRVHQGDVLGLCFLLNHNAAIAAVADDDAMTPLKIALERKDYECAFSLVQYGADVRDVFPSTSSNTAGNSPLGTQLSEHACISTATTTESDPVIHFHKLRFLETLLATSFFTINNVTRLISLDLLTSTQFDNLINNTDCIRQNETQNKLKPFPTCPVAPEETGDVTTSDDTIQSVSSPDDQTVSCVRALLRHSVSLQHQCRLALRRMLGTRLMRAIEKTGLPRRLQNYVCLGVDVHQAEQFRVGELHLAIVEQHATKVNQLLLAGVDPNAPLMDRCPLTRALEVEIEDGDKKDDVVQCTGDDATDEMSESSKAQASSAFNKGIIQLLLRHGASLTSPDPQGDTALHVAVRRGRWLLLKLLSACDFRIPEVDMREGCYVIHSYDAFGLTPLETAALQGDKSMLRLLLKYYYQKGCEPAQKLDTAKPFPEKLPDLSQGQSRTILKQKIRFVKFHCTGLSPLHCAAAAGDAEAVSYLLDQGAPVNAIDHLGNTALHVAVCRGQVLQHELSCYCSLGRSKNYSRLLRCWPLPPLQVREDGGTNQAVRFQCKCGLNLHKPSIRTMNWTKDCGHLAEEKRLQGNGFGKHDGFGQWEHDGSEDRGQGERDSSQGRGLQGQPVSGFLRAQNGKEFSTRTYGQTQTLHHPDEDYELTIQSLLHHGADVTLRNMAFKDALTVALEYGLEDVKLMTCKSVGSL